MADHNDDELHQRALPDGLEVDADEGVAEALIVPFGKPSRIVEQRGNKIIAYDEEWAPGSLERAERASHRVSLQYNHTDDFGNRLGFAKRIWQVDEGYRALFKLDESTAAHARDVASTSHKSTSIAFRSIIPKPLTELDGGTVLRRAAHLLHVALVTDPAFPDARILALRGDGDDGEPTQAEKDEAAFQAELEQVRAQALQLVEDGAKWARWRHDGGGDFTIDAE